MNKDVIQALPTLSVLNSSSVFIGANSSVMSKSIFSNSISLLCRHTLPVDIFENSVHLSELECKTIC